VTPHGEVSSPQLAARRPERDRVGDWYLSVSGNRSPTRRFGRAHAADRELRGHRAGERRFVGVDLIVAGPKLQEVLFDPDRAARDPRLDLLAPALRERLRGPCTVRSLRTSVGTTTDGTPRPRAFEVLKIFALSRGADGTRTRPRRHTKTKSRVALQSFRRVNPVADHVTSVLI
jgi:hypothetical protein